VKNSARVSQLRIGAGLAKYVLKATFRNKAGYFFSFVFPLVFVLIFGMLGNVRQVVRLGVAEGFDRGGAVYRAIEAVAAEEAGAAGAVELVRGSEAELRRKLRYGQIAGILAPDGAPDGTSAAGVALVTAGSGSNRAMAEGILNGVLAELSLRAAGVERPAYRLVRRELPGKAIRHIDFILPGQIGFAMLSLATFGIAYNLATLRKTLVLKRMFATAVKPITFVVAQGLSRSVQAVLQTAVLIAVGVGAFGFTLSQGWASFAAMLFLAFLGILAFIGFGILLSNLADDDHSLPVVLNLFNLPQVLLAGVFFPIDGLPGWVQAVGNNLPLAYLNISLRQVALEGSSLPQVWPYLLGMFAWAAAAYVLAARTFRTE
jgi:ABC-2 type transport system permease protein